MRVKGDQCVPHHYVPVRTFVEHLAGGRDGGAFSVHVDEGAGDEGVGHEGSLGGVGVDGGSEPREAGGGAGLKGEGKGEGIEGKGRGGLHATEESQGLVVAGVVDVRGQQLGAGEQAEVVGIVGRRSHFRYRKCR